MLLEPRDDGVFIFLYSLILSIMVDVDYLSQVYNKLVHTHVTDANTFAVVGIFENP